MENTLLDYLLEFGKSFFQIVATLLPIMNPPSGAAMFLSVTDGASPKTRHTLAKSVASNSFLLMLAFILLGSFVLKFFGISKDIVLIGGGLLVVRIGWELVTADTTTAKHNEQLADSFTPEKIKLTAFFPISFPLTVGPGVLAACLTVGVSFTDTTLPMLITHLCGSMFALIFLALVVRVCYGYAENFMSALGETGAVVFLRICAFILLCLGIQLIWNGFANSITELYQRMSPSATITQMQPTPETTNTTSITQRLLPSSSAETTPSVETKLP